MSEPSPIVPVGQTPAPVVPEEKTVSYETHRQLLNEKKKFQEKAEELAKREEERLKKEQEDKGEYQKLLEGERKRAADLEAKLTDYEQRQAQAKKLSALLKATDGGEIEDKYWGLLPIDKIAIDPATGEVDLNTVAEVASLVKKSYPEIFKKKGPVGLPTDAPQGNGGGKITRDEWLKLDHKEMTKWKPNQII